MDRLTSLPPNHIFVFGSNEAGIHGAGAAKDAMKYFGAITRLGLGLHGQSFAIPTKDVNIRTLPLSEIDKYVKFFNAVTKYEPQLTFHVTPIGTGLAGYSAAEIATLFAKYEWGNNIIWPPEFEGTCFSYTKKPNIIKRTLSRIL